MKSGQAAKWAAHVFKWEEENAGDSRFLDWGIYKSEFCKEFRPASCKQSKGTMPKLLHQKAEITEQLVVQPFGSIYGIGP